MCSALENANFCSMLHHPGLGRNKDSKLWMLKCIFNLKSIMWLCITFPFFPLNNNGNCQLCLCPGWLILIILNESLSVELRFTVITVWITNTAYDADTFGHQTGQTLQITDGAAWGTQKKNGVVLLSNFYCGICLSVRLGHGRSVSWAESLQWSFHYSEVTVRELSLWVFASHSRLNCKV